MGSVVLFGQVLVISLRRRSVRMPNDKNPRRVRLRLLLVLILAWLLSAPLTTTYYAEGVVHLYYFYDPHCSVCEEIHREVLDPLVAEYGDRLVVDERSIAETADFELLLDLEQQFQVMAGSIPEVFIGQDALIGADEIRAKLAERIEHYTAQGGVALPGSIASPEVAPSATPRPTFAFPTAQPNTESGECSECAELKAAIAQANATARAQQATATAEAAGGVVHAVLFWSETCPACHQAREEVLPPIVQQYDGRLQIRAVEVTGDKNETVWRSTLATLGIPEEQFYIPMLIVGDQAFVGKTAFLKELPRLVDDLLAQGGMGMPDVPGVTFEEHPLFDPPETEPVDTQPPTIHAAFFYQPGCDECERSEHDLGYIQEKYPQVQVYRFNVKEEATRNQYLCQQAGVPDDKHLTAPALFVGGDFLIGDQVRARAIEDLLAPYLKTGAAEPWLGWEAETEVVEQTIVERFRSFGILTVVGAGLLDGVNPCAFATMIFLISYLSLRKRQGIELLATGGAFTLGVFLTYLGVGFGFLRFLESLPFLNVIGKWVYALTAVLCLALAWGSIGDYRKAKEGRLEDMSLKLPERLRGWSKALIREGTGAKRFVLSAFLLGLGVSVVELACTGQVYLPTIVYVLGVPALRAQAGIALLLYNLMFILPLIGVFLLVYFGTTSQQLIDWMVKHTAAIKLGTAVLFVLLAGWLIYSIITL